VERRYLSHNGIERLEGVGHLTRLTTLDVANNRSSARAQPARRLPDRHLQRPWEEASAR